jgi:hypothetical protein
LRELRALSGNSSIVAAFAELPDRIEDNGVRTVIVEDASRFVRGLASQELGILALIEFGVCALTWRRPVRPPGLPASPHIHLPAHAQGIDRSAFNNAWTQYKHRGSAQRKEINPKQISSRLLRTSSKLA